MPDDVDFERQLQARLLARAAIASRPFDPVQIARSAVVGTGTDSGRRSPHRLRPVNLLVAAALAIAIAGGTVIAVGSALRSLRTDPDIIVTPPMSWIGLGEMSEARRGHTATLLADGRVLVVGGQVGDVEGDGSGPSLASAEIFDPATRAWAPTGQMTAPRKDHHAVRLPDGRVIAVGGTRDPEPAEIWDPATGLWSALGVPTRPPEGDAALLPDGRLLIAGGILRRTAAVLDPTTGTWDETGPFSEVRYNHRLVLLRDGSALVIAGDRDGDRGKIEVEQFDPLTNSWSVVGSLHPDTHSHAATLLDDGHILIVGAERPIASFAQLFEPATGESTVLAGAPAVWGHGDGIVLPDGRVLFASSDGTGVFDQRSGSWTAAPGLAEPRDAPITALASGEVLVVGGRVVLGERGTRSSSGVDLFGYER